MDHLDRLLTWINGHDCGVSPTGILTANGTIHIEARDALGY